MDIEKLKEVIKVFEGLGSEAKESFIWYLITTNVPPFIIGLIWTVGGLVILNKIVPMVKSLLPSVQLLRAYGSHYNSWSSHELEDACEILRKAKSERGN